MNESKLKSIFVALDGKTSGFTAKLDATGNYVTGKDGKMKLFRNINLLKSWVETVDDIKNPYDFKIFMVIDGKTIDYNDMQKIYEYYEYYDPETEQHYFIAEDNTEKVLDIGYIVFEDGNTPHKETNPKEGKKKSNELMDKVKYIIGIMLRRPYNGIDSMDWVNSYKSENGSHLEIKLKGSTGKIHILKNSELIEFNMIRKDIGERCLPYLKDMDKYKTLYVYITKDNGDIKSADKEASKVLERFIEAIQYLEPELDARYIHVEFNGNIFIGGLEHESNKN